MMVNLASELARLGVSVDFVLSNIDKRPYLSSMSEQVNVVGLDSFAQANIVDNTVAYLKQDRPAVLLCAKDSSYGLAIEARDQSQSSTKVYFRSVVNMTQRLKSVNFLKRWRIRKKMKHLYQAADGVLAISHGVAVDVLEMTGIAPAKVKIVPNPVVTDKLIPQSMAAPDHPWFVQKDKPIVLGVGRLGRQKNFYLLINAFAELRKQRDCRLVIIGAGRQQDRLIRLAEKLGVNGDVALIGFKENPYAFMRNADVFVLSSRWEGFGNVVAESLALGLPVVSTDCPSGPREILQDGKYGKLVPVDEIEALADAMRSTLDSPLSAEQLMQGAEPYTAQRSALAYKDALGLGAV